MTNKQVSTKKKTTQSTEDSTNANGGDTKFFEVTYPTVTSRMKTLCVQLPPMDRPYEIGDKTFRSEIMKAFKHVGLPTSLFSHPVSNEEIEFARDNLQPYGMFQRKAISGDPSFFNKDGHTYIVIDEKVIDVDTNEEATNINLNDIKSSAKTVKAKFLDYYDLLIQQPFWTRYLVENGENGDAILADFASLSDFMSTYTACMELAKNSLFLQMVQDHFGVSTQDTHLGIDQVFDQVLEQRKIRNQFFPLQKISKWVNKSNPAEFTTAGDLITNTINVLTEEIRFIKNEAHALHGLHVRRLIEDRMGHVEGGMPVELTQLLNSISGEKWLEVVPQEQWMKDIETLIQALNNCRNKLVLKPYNPSASINMTPAALVNSGDQITTTDMLRQCITDLMDKTTISAEEQEKCLQRITSSIQKKRKGKGQWPNSKRNKSSDAIQDQSKSGQRFNQKSNKT